jgi:hypothetical protein
MSSPEVNNQPRPTALPQLAAAGFDADALPINQAGRVSGKQRLKLLSNPASYPPLAVVHFLRVAGFMALSRVSLAAPSRSSFW